MNIAAFLETKAHNLATAKQAEANTIKTELEEIEREKVKLQAKFDAMRHAVKRAINFPPAHRDGLPVPTMLDQQ